MKNYIQISGTAVLLAVLIFVVFSCRQAGEENYFAAEARYIDYLTENYPPFNYEEGEIIHGVSVDILEELLMKMNVDPKDVNLQVMDWSLAYQQTLNEPNSMLFSTVRSTEREQLFKWVGPIAPQKQVLVARKSSGINIDNDQQMAAYTIGVVEDYSDYQLLIDAGVPQEKLVQKPDVGSLYDALAKGEVQCLAYTEISNKLILESYGYDPEDFEVVYTFNVSQLYYAFNVNTPEALIAYFQGLLEELKLDKTQDGSSVYEKILNHYQVIQHLEDNISEQMVIDLVDQTAADLENDAPGTIEKINKGDAPYLDPGNPALYAFVYDTAVNIVAHATNPLLVGKNFKGKTDAAGKPFRDFIVQGALANGTGWVDYIYTRPDESGLYQKTTFYKLSTGSNGKLYVVCAGRYK